MVVGEMVSLGAFTGKGCGTVSPLSGKEMDGSGGEEMNGWVARPESRAPDPIKQAATMNLFPRIQADNLTVVLQLLFQLVN